MRRRLGADERKPHQAADAQPRADEAELAELEALRAQARAQVQMLGCPPAENDPEIRQLWADRRAAAERALAEIEQGMDASLQALECARRVESDAHAVMRRLEDGPIEAADEALEGVEEAIRQVEAKLEFADACHQRQRLHRRHALSARVAIASRRALLRTRARRPLAQRGAPRRRPGPRAHGAHAPPGEDSESEPAKPADDDDLAAGVRA